MNTQLIERLSASSTPHLADACLRTGVAVRVRTGGPAADSLHDTVCGPGSPPASRRQRGRFP